MRISKAKTLRERLALVILALLGIFDSLIIIFTFTIVDSDYQADFLFSELCDRLTRS